MTDEVKVALHFLELILNNNGEMTSNGLTDLFEIKQGNKKVILQHLKAINSIISKAINDIENGGKE